MRRLIRSLALSLSLSFAWFGGGASAQTAAVATATIPAPAPVKPALWKISDADTTIYLFGTIHALPAGVDWLHGPVAAAFKDSSQLVTEIPETDPAQMQAAVISNAVLPVGKNLREMLSAGDRARFEKALSDFGLPVESFDRFEPWYAAVALTGLPLAREGYSAENGVDEKISAAGKAQGQPRIGLETAAQQLSIFDSLPLEVQKNYLHEVLDGLPTFDKELADIVAQWSVGNADKLAELLNADEDDPRMVEALLINRNRNWAAWIKDRMAKPGTIFMAVGAGHLAGKDSVQAVLAKSGIVATRVQ